MSMPGTVIRRLMLASTNAWLKTNKLDYLDSMARMSQLNNLNAFHNPVTFLRVLTKDSCEFLCVCGEGCGLLQVVQ